MIDSTNLTESFLGQRQPVYPIVSQLLRVTGPRINPFENVYPCLVEQATMPTVGLRDREPAYLWEPNLIPLSPLNYLGRLVGNYLGLPLYVTSQICCGTPSSLSSSSISSSSVSSSFSSSLSSSLSSSSASSLSSSSQSSISSISSLSSSSASSSSASSASSSSAAGCTVQFRSTSFASGSPNTVSIPKPTGAVPGDRLIAIIAYANSTVIAVPGGWTLIQSDINGDVGMDSYYKTVGGSEPGSYSWTIQDNPELSFVIGRILCIFNAGAAPSDKSTNHDTGLNCTALSVTTSLPRSMLIGSWDYDSGIGTLAPPASMTDLGFNSFTSVSLDVAYEIQNAAGASGNRTATGGQAGAKEIGQLIAWPPLCIQTVCCLGRTIPPVLIATLANNGLCACLDGITVNLTWSSPAPGVDQWVGSTTVACVNTPITVSLTCDNGIWEASFFCGEFGVARAVVATIDCGPPFMGTATFGPGYANMGSCCPGGSITITFTES